MASCPAALQITRRHCRRVVGYRSVSTDYTSSCIHGHFAIAAGFRIRILELSALRNFHSKILDHAFQPSQSLQ
jgi:hypothetical protein